MVSLVEIEWSDYKTEIVLYHILQLRVNLPLSRNKKLKKQNR